MGLMKKSLKSLGKNAILEPIQFKLKGLAEKELKKMGENIDDYHLFKVSMKVKGYSNREKATLIVGSDKDSMTLPQSVSPSIPGKDPDPTKAFLSGQSNTYSKVDWELTGEEGQPDERWQIEFDGNIRVLNIKVHLEKVNSPFRVRIPMKDELLVGEIKIFIREELKDLGYKLDGLELDKVILVAKSRLGQATARLQRGQSFSNVKNVDASQEGLSFQSDRPRSYNRISFNGKDAGDAIWRLHINGHVKVKAVIVHLK